VIRCGFLGLLHMDVFHQRLEQVGDSLILFSLAVDNPESFEIWSSSPYPINVIQHGLYFSFLLVC